MLQEVAENVRCLRVPRTGHWVPEENPEAVANALLEFAATRTGPWRFQPSSAKEPNVGLPTGR